MDRAAIVEPLLAAYAAGVFPMADPESGRVGWYDPPARGVIPLEEGGLRLGRSLRQRVRSDRFRVTSDVAFGRVIRACAAPRADQHGDTWIDARIVSWYETLHAEGHAHSVEAWLDDPASPGKPRLVGGLYGVALRGLFAGESMFSRPDLGGTDASKVCLVHLWHHLRAGGFTLLDCQFWTPHLGRLGCVEIDRADYQQRLAAALQTPATWGVMASQVGS